MSSLECRSGIADHEYLCSHLPALQLPTQSLLLRSASRTGDPSAEHGRNQFRLQALQQLCDKSTDSRRSEALIIARATFHASVKTTLMIGEDQPGSCPPRIDTDKRLLAHISAKRKRVSKKKGTDQKVDPSKLSSAALKWSADQIVDNLSYADSSMMDCAVCVRTSG